MTSTKREEIWEQLRQALPTEFDFYHLGKVEIAQPHIDEASKISIKYSDKDLTPKSDDVQFLGYQLYGEFSAWVILYIEELAQPEGQDLARLSEDFAKYSQDIYSEIGNILSAKITEYLYKTHGWEMMISPPRRLTQNRIVKLLENHLEPLRQLYIHRFGGQSVLVEVSLFPDPSFSNLSSSDVINVV